MNRHRILLPLLLLLAACTSRPPSPPSFNFLGLPWDANADQVRQAMKSTGAVLSMNMGEVSDYHVLQYTWDSLWGQPVSTWHFNLYHDTLVETMILFEEAPDSLAGLSVYADLVRRFERTLGKPILRGAAPLTVDTSSWDPADREYLHHFIIAGTDSQALWMPDGVDRQHYIDIRPYSGPHPFTAWILEYSDGSARQRMIASLRQQGIIPPRQQGQSGERQP